MIRLFILSACLVAAATSGILSAAEPDTLPRFTEEREAAALFFVKKQLPELMPLLEGLKKGNATQYEHEIREIFQITELLADLRDDPRRHELELKIWRAENKAHTLVAKLSSPAEEERKTTEGKLLELAKELVELDTQVLELRAEHLEKELGAVKDELARTRDNPEKQAKERFDALLEKAKKKVK